ncbi:hypothetical protein PAXINDRAFT_171272 [Paxillus involutus ATCC 200175]|jgi:hypothetical protein|uniref:Uncharacterized protein n=1 Tax=Paxillus involutus ATCC 200175 TaxID=664439 RepID=A0A0C9TXJ3_PAXIN|nr:hypothetical protein PAXINDRAFT_171272 [Paxillus involutus ATCC 200175]
MPYHHGRGLLNFFGGMLLTPFQCNNVHGAQHGTFSDNTSKPNLIIVNRYFKLASVDVAVPNEDACTSMQAIIYLP